MGRSRLLALSLAFCAVTAACKETTLEDRPCPPEGTRLTWESFGEGFIDAYCQGCHGQRLKDRKGAPSGYDFASVEDVRRFRSRIFARAAADNTTMPPGPDDPPLAEREQLAEWLACGAP